MSCVLLLFLYLRIELSFDQFHPEKSTLYRAVTHATINGNEINTPTTPSGLGPAMGVEIFCRISTVNETVIGTGDRLFTEDKIYEVEKTFFELFDFKILEGSTEKFTDNHIILTQLLARKLFGDEDAIGKSLNYNSSDKRVIAVIESPVRSHLDFSALVLNSDYIENWGQFSVYTYFNSINSNESIKSNLDNIYEERMAEIFTANNSSCKFDIQRVTDIHLTSHLRGELAQNARKVNIYAFILIAVFMLLVAGINYSNMATARSLRRSKEIGIRKAIGSYRSELIIQFLMESILLVFFGVFLSLIIVDQILPYFNFISGLEAYDITKFDWQLGIFVFFVVLVIGVLGGLYPAVVMSKFSATDILKGTFTDYSDKLTMRRLLVVIQFSISILMIICTWFILSQINYINNKNLGFSNERVLTVEIPSLSEVRLLELKDLFVKTELTTSISTSEQIPGETTERLGTFLYLNQEGQWEEKLAKYFSADQEFIECFEISLLEGANFRQGQQSHNLALVNESFAANFDRPIDVGTTIRLPFKNAYGYNQVKIAGIVNDFHFRSLHEEVQPLLILYDERNNHLLVKLKDINSEGLEILRSAWVNVYPDYPFDYEFVDEKIDNLYRSEILTGKIFALFALITSLLACLGLFALSFYTSELRKKEIGIRKINGAGVGEILYLINREYVLLVTIATLVSWPIGYFIVNEWLAEFAYKIDINLGVFVLSLVLALLITLATVSHNTIKAAKENIVSVINRG